MASKDIWIALGVIYLACSFAWLGMMIFCDWKDSKR